MYPVVIIPTFDERLNLPPHVDALLQTDEVRVLVVDDASPDGTGAEADRLAAAHPDRVAVIHRTGRRGFGPSLIEGMLAALARGATRVLQIDADFSHDPSDVPRLLEASRTADLVIGSRYVPGGQLRNWPVHRVALSTFANRYVRAITRLPIRDCTSGFRCWRSELLAQLPLERIVSDGYAFQVELTWEAHLAGARITEVPIIFVERRQGASKMSGRMIAESALLPWRLAARPRTRRG